MVTEFYTYGQRACAGNMRRRQSRDLSRRLLHVNNHHSYKSRLVHSRYHASLVDRLASQMQMN